MKKIITLKQSALLISASLMLFSSCSKDDAVANVAVSSVTLSSTTATLGIGRELRISATILPENATTKTIMWESSNEAIVTVDATGKVKALTIGEAIITAKVGDKTATCIVTVPDWITIEDAIFKGYLVSICDSDHDGEISKTEALMVMDMRLGWSGDNGPKISSLDGIEFFANLTTLYCSENQLTTLDVSKNTALTTLNCSGNQLTTLDVSGCAALTVLGCHNNQLTTLDVSGCAALTVLSCRNNQLTTLDVSKCTALTEIHCHENQLTTINMGKSTTLDRLYCFNNKLAMLDLSKSPALTRLLCHANQLTVLDVSKNPDMVSLLCYSNQLTVLDVSKNPDLVSLYCYSNQLTELDVSKNTVLTTLFCSNNQLPELDISKNTKLTDLNCTFNSGMNNIFNVKIWAGFSSANYPNFHIGSNGVYVE